MEHLLEKNDHHPLRSMEWSLLSLDSSCEADILYDFDAVLTIDYNHDDAAHIARHIKLVVANKWYYQHLQTPIRRANLDLYQKDHYRLLQLYIHFIPGE